MGISYIQFQLLRQVLGLERQAIPTRPILTESNTYKIQGKHLNTRKNNWRQFFEGMASLVYHLAYTNVFV